MDIATLLGLIIGFGAVIGGQVLEGGHISALIQPTAALIVAGGTSGATLVSFPMKTVLNALRDAKTTLFFTEYDPETTIRLIARLAETARREGLLVLEAERKIIKDRFINKALTLLVDGAEEKRFVEFMEIELNTFEEEGKASAEVFEAAGGFAPTIGIIGAVLGLIHVMSNLSDTASLGAGIAVAFVATIYGLMTANIICIPISTKLKKRMKEQLLVKEIAFQGLLSVQQGENPRLIVEKLHGYRRQMLANE